AHRSCLPQLARRSFDLGNSGSDTLSLPVDGSGVVAPHRPSGCRSAISEGNETAAETQARKLDGHSPAGQGDQVILPPHGQGGPEMTVLVHASRPQGADTSRLARPQAVELRRRVARMTIFVPALATVVAVASAIAGIARPSAFELALAAALCLVTQL